MTSLSVVIVDDEPWIVSLIKGLIPWSRLNLRLAGEAIDGWQALELCRQVCPDILITDIRMPNLDGLDLIDRVRGVLPNTEVVVVSGHDEFEYARRALRLQVLDFLLKPVNRGELEKVLERAIRRCETRSLHPAPTDDEADSLQVALESACSHPRIRMALRYIYQHHAAGLTLQEIAATVNMGPSYFSEIFKREVGIGYVEHLTRLRIEKAKRLLEAGHLMVYEVASAVGYENANYFSRLFKKHVGCSASRYAGRPDQQDGVQKFGKPYPLQEAEPYQQ